MRLDLDDAHIFASSPATTVEFFQPMFGAVVARDAVVAGVRGIRLQVGRAAVMGFDQPPKAPRGGAFHHLGIEIDDLVRASQSHRSRADSPFESRPRTTDLSRTSWSPGRTICSSSCLSAASRLGGAFIQTTKAVLNVDDAEPLPQPDRRKVRLQVPSSLRSPAAAQAQR